MGKYFWRFIISSIWSFVVFVPFVTGEFQQTLYTASYGNNIRLNGTPSRSFSVSSQGNCAVECSSKGFNVRNVSAESSLLCECFSTVPYDISRAILFEKQASFYESTCLGSPLPVRAADPGVETAGDYVVKVLTSVPEAGFMYLLKFTKTFDSHSLTDSVASVKAIIDGHLDTISSTFTAMISGKMYLWFIDNDRVTCYGVGWCIGPYPIHFSNILKGWNSGMKLDAFLPTDGTLTSVFAFGNGYVYEIRLTTPLKWELVSTGLIADSLIWTGAPDGIIAASWIRRVGSSVDTSIAVLFTPDYFVVYKMSGNTVVYRGQLCVP